MGDVYTSPLFEEWEREFSNQIEAFDYYWHGGNAFCEWLEAKYTIAPKPSPSPAPELPSESVDPRGIEAMLK